MIPAPRSGGHAAAPSASTSTTRPVLHPPVSTAPAAWSDLDLDDDDGWQDMPVVRSDDFSSLLDQEDEKRYHYKVPARLDGDGGPSDDAGGSGSGAGGAGAGAGTGNATGTHLELESDTLLTESWREKMQQDESDYTRLRLDEDEESEEVHMRTRYLFDEDKAMTPLSQMQATKQLLTEGQRIAYVGLCQLIARRMLRDMGRGWEGSKLRGKAKVRAALASSSSSSAAAAAEVPCVESGTIWMIKIMARLYQHMELERDEQRMIESLAEHGVDPSDLVPALMTTHTVKNPEYDPEAKKRAQAAEADALADEAEIDIDDPAPPYEPPDRPTPSSSSEAPPSPSSETPASSLSSSSPASSSSSSTPAPASRPPPLSLPSLDTDPDEGDIGAARSPPRPLPQTSSLSSSRPPPTPPTPSTPIAATLHDPEHDPEKTPRHDGAVLLPEAREPLSQENQPMPALPGVSTSLTTADEVVTLDIRWTVLCDLFLVLIADSVYDARSRAFLERVANALGFGWLDVVRFENRVTDALEIQEGVGQLQQIEVIETRRKGALKKRYAMMGLAAVGGGLVIGLSAGLLAPVIGAGLGAAFATVGITGTTGFLAGAGGAAMITTGGVLTGANIAGKGMARRTREVRTFEFKPLHNNKRVSCYITVGGFMASKVDDVRLPFSVLDSIVGDVFSVLWEPEMMNEMGNALKILTSEVLTQVGQQILQATVMTALMSALQWPMILTKLGYLIDNPWSNALDRAKAAGLVLADVLIQRHAGVRPTSLIGFSLGARVIFFALAELARQKAYGIVQDVYLFGATVTASKQTWLDARSIVAGRFVNGFASNDWMLGYLFRMTSGGLNTVAGLRPVETVPGLENVEVTDCITGHMSYRSAMPQLLARVGFPVTAEMFDEPDDPDTDMSVQERYVVNEEAEEEAKANQKKLLGIFPRSQRGSRAGSRAGSGTTTPTRKSSADTGAAVANGHDEDEDDLPPREPSSRQQHEVDLGDLPGATASTDSLNSEEAAVRAIPKTAGFDFAAISKALGKEIDVDKLKEPPVTVPLRMPTPPGPIERSESAPPLSLDSPGPDDDSTPHARSASVIGLELAEEDEDGDGDGFEDGDIAAGANRALNLGDMPAWDRPAWTSASTGTVPRLSPVQPGGLGSGSGFGFGSGSGSGSKPPASSSFFNFNAWTAPSSSSPSISPSSSSSPSSAFTTPMRSAPPARPHPAELMANPFASAGGAATSGGSNTAAWAKDKEEKLALENPW